MTADANTAGKRRRRFVKRGFDGLRSGAPRKIGDERTAEDIARTLEESPPGGTHWSLCTVGCAPSASSRTAWRRSSCPWTRDLWRRRAASSTSISTRRNERSCCASTRRTRFRRVDIATGEIVDRCLARHLNREFLKFLRTIEAGVPADLDANLVMDNCATHKTPAVRHRLAGWPYWRVHITPTGARWLNHVERFFALLTGKQIRRERSRSTQDFEQTIRRYIESVDANPGPFRWTRSTDGILTATKRLRLRTRESSDRQREITKPSESGR